MSKRTHTDRWVRRCSDRAWSVRPHRRRRSLALSVLAGTAVMTSGCGQSVVTTTIDSSGSYTRNLKFTDDNETDTPLGQLFRLPSGASWNTKLTKTSDNVTTFTALRTFAPGDTDAKDIVVVVRKGETLTNSASVRRIKPGLWEYREVLHWTGPADPSISGANDLTSIVKEALPPEFATDTNAADVGQSILRAFTSSALGPPSPTIDMVMVGNEDLSNKILEKDVDKPIDVALRQRFGDRMTAAQRHEVVRKIVYAAEQTGSDTASNAATNSNAGSSPPNVSRDSPEVNSLTFVLRPPGKVRSTNGIYNDYTGEVVWGLDPLSASFGDVVLTADYQTTQASADK